jgi:hypothetical protein
LALAFVASAGVYAASVDPLEPGAGGVVLGEVQTDDPGATGRFRHGIRFVPLGPVRWGFGVRNPLLVPVTIRGLDADADLHSTLVTDTTLHLVDGEIMAPDRLRPFAPIQLGPGEEVFLAVSEHFTDCAWAQERWIAGSALIRQDIVFEVDVLGIPRFAHVPLPFELSYAAPEEEACQG